MSTPSSAWKTSGDFQGAMTMYTHDNHDLFPPNPDDGNTVPGHEWVAGQAGGGMPPGASAPGEATDPRLHQAAAI